MKKLIIVCDDSTEKYANYLRQLISSIDDKDGEIVGVKDGEVDALVWNEKQYKSNALQLSSIQHILFIGNNETTKLESSNVKYVFDKYGMKYGWLGKRGVACVDGNLEENEYKEFLEYYKNYGQELKKISFKFFGDEESNNINNDMGNTDNKLGILDIALIPIAIPFLLGEAGLNAAKGIQVQGKILEQRYSALMTIFYLKDLAKFMES